MQRMGALQTAVGRPQCPGSDTTQIQSTLMPPAAVSAVLTMRYDTVAREGSCGITVKDRSDGTECAMVAMPFRRCDDVEQLLTEAVERLRSVLEAVLNPDPF
jgi:hypothetical protein